MSPEELSVAEGLDVSDLCLSAWATSLADSITILACSGFGADLSDAPSNDASGMSPNHGGSIIQVLYSGRSVGVLTSAKVKGGHDDMFSNMEGNVAAGYGTRRHRARAPAKRRRTSFFITDRSSNVRLQKRQLQPSRNFVSNSGTAEILIRRFASSGACSAAESIHASPRHQPHSGQLQLATCGWVPAAMYAAAAAAACSMTVCEVWPRAETMAVGARRRSP